MGWQHIRALTRNMAKLKKIMAAKLKRRARHKNKHFVEEDREDEINPDNRTLDPWTID